MTVSEMGERLSHAEYVAWAAFYADEQAAAERAAKRRRR